MRVGFVGCDDGNDNGFQDRKLLQVLTFAPTSSLRSDVFQRSVMAFAQPPQL